MRISQWIGLFIFVFSSICFSGAEASASGLNVYVSILPQKYFVERISGDKATVHVMVRPGDNPETYEPKPKQMAALMGAKLYFAVGVPFEQRWLPRFVAANPNLTVVHTEDGIQKIPMRAHHDPPTALHGDRPPDQNGHHGKDGLDPHIWLAPPLVKVQAQHIYRALAAADPGNRPVYEENWRRFRSEIDRLDADLRRLLAPQKGQSFMVFHPAWGYFAWAYGLYQVPVEIEGKGLKPSQLGSVIDRARKAGIRVVFVQPQFSTRSAGVIADAIGGRVVFADPLAGDWEKKLRDQALQFREALR